MSKLIDTLNLVLDLELAKDLINIIFDYTPQKYLVKLSKFKHYNNEEISCGSIAVDYNNDSGEFDYKMKRIYKKLPIKNPNACIYVADLSTSNVNGYKLLNKLHMHTHGNVKYIGESIDFGVTTDGHYFLRCWSGYISINKNYLQSPYSHNLSLDVENLFVLHEKKQIIFTKKNKENQEDDIYIYPEGLTNSSEKSEQKAKIIKDDISEYYDNGLVVESEYYSIVQDDKWTYLGSKVQLREGDKTCNAVYVLKENDCYLYVLRKRCVEIYKEVNLYE